jgi:hypothetical protein
MTLRQRLNKIFMSMRGCLIRQPLLPAGRKRAVFVAIGLTTILCVVIITAAWPTGLSSEGYAAGLPRITIDVFYMNPCAACKTEDELAERINKVLYGVRADVEIDLRMNNTFHKASEDLLNHYYEKYDVPESARGLSPVIFIGRTAVPDGSQFEDRLKTAFLAAKPDPGEASPADNGGYPDDDIAVTSHGTDSVIIYFFVSPCSACEAVDQLYKGMDARYDVNNQGKTISSRIVIQKYNVGDPANLELVRRYFAAYQVPEKDQKTPVVFIGKTWLSGEKEITSHLMEKIRGGEGLASLEILPSEASAAGLGGKITDFEVIGVFLTGLLNGFNPCSLSMLLLLISLIAAKSESILKLGFAFIAGKLMAYFALGALFFNLLGAIDTSAYSLVNKILKGILLVIIAGVIVLNILDMMAARREKYGDIRLQLPTALRKINHRWIKSISAIKDNRLLVPTCFVLGIVISVGEFMCTGQLYLATIIQLLHAGRTFDFRAAGCFLLYGAALVIPLSILILAIHKGMAIFNLSEAIRKKMPLIKIANAMVFFGFGLVFLLLD